MVGLSKTCRITVFWRKVSVPMDLWFPGNPYWLHTFGCSHVFLGSNKKALSSIIWLLCQYVKMVFYFLFHPCCFSHICYSILFLLLQSQLLMVSQYFSFSSILPKCFKVSAKKRIWDLFFLESLINSDISIGIRNSFVHFNVCVLIK